MCSDNFILNELILNETHIQEVNEASEGGWPPFLSRPYPVFPNGTKIMRDKKGQKY